MAQGVFSLSDVRTSQLKNLVSADYKNNYKSWPELGQYGYFGGGYLSSVVSRVDFSNETASNPGKNLPSSNFFTMWGTGSSNYGYFGNGYGSPAPAPVFSGAFKLDFSNEVISNPGGINFTRPRYGADTVKTEDELYITGGFENSVFWPPFVDKLTFATETTSTTNPSPSGRELNCGVYGSQYGYFGGGTISPAQSNTTSNIFRLDFNTEIFTNNPVNLPQNLVAVGSASDLSSDYGYFAGGSLTGSPGMTNRISNIYRVDFSTNVINEVSRMPIAQARVKSIFNNSLCLLAGNSGGTIEKFDFANYTSSRSGASISPGRDAFASVSSGRRIPMKTKSFGYLVGGGEPTSLLPLSSNIERIDFSTDVITNLSSKLSQEKNHLKEVSNNNYSYFNGGLGPLSNSISSIDRLDFSNEVCQNISPKGLSIERSKHFSSSSSNYGYICGGSTPFALYAVGTNRLDFSTEVVQSPANFLLPISRIDAGSFSNNSYAYAGGGRSSTAVESTIDRLDFSSETMLTLSSILSGRNEELSATSNNSYGYFVGGDGPFMISLLDRLDFSTETIFTPGRNLITARSNFGSTSSTSYGYFCSGALDTVNSIFTSTIERLDFSTETISQSTSNMTRNTTNISASSNSN